MAALGLHCCVWAFSSCSEWGLLSLWCVGVSLWWLLFLQSMGTRVCRLQLLLCPRLSCSKECGTFLDQDLTHTLCTGRQILNH